MKKEACRSLQLAPDVCVFLLKGQMETELNQREKVRSLHASFGLFKPYCLVISKEFAFGRVMSDVEA